MFSRYCTKDIFTSGVATALSAEIIELMKYAMAGGHGHVVHRGVGVDKGKHAVHGVPPHGLIVAGLDAAEDEEPVMGHFTDAQVRELGVPLVTRDIPGVAVITGKPSWMAPAPQATVMSSTGA